MSIISDGFEQNTDYTLKGHGKEVAKYIDITAGVCKHLCEELHSDSCCSVLYDRSTRSCLITPLDEKSLGVQKTKKVYSDYYRRKKCQGEDM